jgi:spermidine synthase
VGNPVTGFGALYLFFFFSGISGLIYQVVWVRVFGNVFGNTVYSTSLVIAVFMLGLGVGSFVAGAWADRRYANRTESLLKAYAYFELFIGVMGLGISALLPHMGQVSALVSSYTPGPSGWYDLSSASYLARAAIAVVLLTPITLLMGGTLTLLIRHLVRRDLDTGGWRIALLYAMNTAGAALGCFLTDFVLVPSAGLRGAQMVAVLLNVVAAVGALSLASRTRDGLKTVPYRDLEPAALGRRGRSSDRPAPKSSVGDGLQTVPHDQTVPSSRTVPLTSLALAMSGFAAMGMEILWFRHFSILLGGFRAVFSLLLTVILIGIGAGSLMSGFLYRRTGRPAQWLMVVQGFFVASTLLGLAIADARNIEAVVVADRAYQAAAGRAVEVALSEESGWARTFTELWFNTRPILLEVGIPALLMGFSFPFANAIVQRAERSVGRRAGVLYLSNTIGAVCGSLTAGFVLLPTLGIQGSATVLTIAAGLAVVPLYLAGRRRPEGGRDEESVRPNVSGRDGLRAALVGSMVIGGAALGLWFQLPSDYVISRALAQKDNERLLARSEGLTEVIAVVEVAAKGRTLFTNGHPMSSTARLSQRYMRAMAHIPLLSIDNPETVLVIGFGVGNTTHAATLHPSVRRVEVADLSRGILAHSSYFKDANGDVLNDPRVVVYVNDGRHHLQIQRAAAYDLITLEPPPIGYAGVAALYSEEFYALARSRLKPRGYISQWLPAYQVPTATTLAMIRAFIDVFPQTVLISGAEADLLLIGANDSRIEIDPARLSTILARAPAVQADLRRLDLGSVREIVGTFVGSAQKLAEATRNSPPVSDDRPLQEYGVKSLLNFGEAVPASVVDLTQVTAWCPKCFVDSKPVPLVEGLDMYLALLGRAYTASAVEVARVRSLDVRQTRVIAGSTYLGAIVPESADLHNALGIALAEKGKIDEAVAEFSEALRLEPDSARTHWHLGAALASRGAREEAIAHLHQSVQLDPKNGEAQYDLARLLVDVGQPAAAVDHFRATLRLIPNSVEAHTGLGLALAVQGKVDEAIDQFQLALTLDPASADAQRNLAIALRQRRR